MVAADQLVAPAFQNPPPTAYDPRGFAVGVLANDEVGQRGLKLRQWRWRYGPELREHPFLKHKALDGAFASLEGTVSGFYPDDHKGCRCSVAPVYIAEDTGRFVTEAELRQPMAPETFAEYTTHEAAEGVYDRYDAFLRAADTESGRDLLDARDHYSGVMYDEINRHFRQGTPFNSSVVQEWVDGIDEGFGHVRLTENTTLYRGIYRDSLPEIQDAFDAGTLVGSEITDAGYQSTSLERDTAVSFAGLRRSIILEIRTHAGQSVLPVNRRESEIVLPRGSRLRVLEAEWTEIDERPYRRIVAEVVR